MKKKDLICYLKEIPSTDQGHQIRVHTFMWKFYIGQGSLEKQSQ
jgi:hypothetical protein